MQFLSEGLQDFSNGYHIAKSTSPSCHQEHLTNFEARVMHNEYKIDHVNNHTVFGTPFHSMCQRTGRRKWGRLHGGLLVKWWDGQLCSFLCITSLGFWSWATLFSCNYWLWCSYHQVVAYLENLAGKSFSWLVLSHQMVEVELPQWGYSKTFAFKAGHQSACFIWVKPSELLHEKHVMAYLDENDLCQHWITSKHSIYTYILST